MSHRFKQITPTDHFGWHAAYLEVYEKLFAPFKDRSMTLLEIGTDGGGGLRMYEDYFPKGIIYGYDISPTPDSAKGRDRITHHQRDAYTEDSVRFMVHGHRLDIIIDDGPHTLGSQEFFARHYPNLLSDDGIAIIEDIAEPHHLAHLQSCVGPEFFTMGIDLTHHDERRFDNRLLAIWRR